MKNERIEGRIMFPTRLFLTLCAAVAISTPAFAVDGVTLVDQATVVASGGFPYHIKNPGSYRLSGDLLATGTTAIVIAAPNVTLDLNGFTVSCNGCSGVPGIVATAIRTVIENGNVTGFNGTGPSYGILLLDNGDGPFDYQATIDHVNADSNFVGIRTAGAINLSVSNSSASFNSYDGIEALPGPGGSLTVTNSKVNENGNSGIQMGNGLVTGSAIVSNGLGSPNLTRGGIGVIGTEAVAVAATITNNTISGNQQYGLFAVGGSATAVGYGSNTFVGSGAVQIYDPFGLCFSMKNNVRAGGLF